MNPIILNEKDGPKVHEARRRHLLRAALRAGIGLSTNATRGCGACKFELLQGESRNPVGRRPRPQRTGSTAAGAIWPASARPKAAPHQGPGADSRRRRSAPPPDGPTIGTSTSPTTCASSASAVPAARRIPAGPVRHAGPAWAWTHPAPIRSPTRRTTTANGISQISAGSHGRAPTCCSTSSRRRRNRPGRPLWRGLAAHRRAAGHRLRGLGGSGLAPMVSIARGAVEAGMLEEPPAVLLLRARTPRDVRPKPLAQLASATGSCIGVVVLAAGATENGKGGTGDAATSSCRSPAYGNRPATNSISPGRRPWWPCRRC